MADQQKIHPVDVEAPPPPSAPLAPRDALGSEKGEPAAPPPSAPVAPRNALGSEKGDPAADHTQPAGQFPPPYRRSIPVSHSKPPKKRRSCCCRCLCWTVCSLLLLVILVAATIGILYLIFQPKVPKYTVDRLRISAFDVDSSLNVRASFDVTVTARNPNKKIGIYYEDGSHLSVWYTDTSLCSGKFPVFYQGHRNTTVLGLVLTGQTQVGGGLLTALQTQQQTGMIPLVFRGDVPVKVKFGSLKLWKVRFLVNCNVVVNSLSVNNQISIRTSSCRFKLKL